MKRFFYLLFLICAVSPILAQTYQISGKVTDTNDNSPLAGATVQTKNKTATMTDAEGRYAIQVNKGDSLTFSLMGMKAKSVLITSNKNIDIALEEMSLDLDEIIIVGYGTMKKSDLTGAVSSVNTEDLKTMATAGIVGAIQGRVAGVNITSTSGEPGEGMQVRIRGIGTVNNSDPLYVIDGFPGASMDFLQPGDIESMEILKDASATAIYGSRGANGVILIKTRSGRKNSFSVTLDAYAGVSKIAKRYKLTNASEWAQLKLDALYNAGKNPSVEDNAILSNAIANNYKGTDWQEEIFRENAIIQNYNISINGGTEKNIYDIGLNFSKNDGIVKNTGDDKWSFHINNEYSFSKHVKLGVNLAYVNYNRNHDRNGFYNGTISWALYSDPLTPAWDKNTNNYGKYYYSGQTNPLVTIDDNKNRKSKSDKISARGFLQLEDIFTKGLSFRSQYGYDMNFDLYKQYLFAYYIDTDKKRDQSSLQERKSEFRQWINSNVVTYVTKIDKHSINSMIGMEMQESRSQHSNITAYNVPKDANLHYFDAAKDKNSIAPTGSASENAILSYFARLNYSFNNRYLVTATWRADGSSKFLGDNRWGYFPSFSLGWNAHEETFLRTIQPLSQLKIRAGWGQVGNEGSVNSYEYAAAVENNFNYSFNNGPILNGSTPRVLSNKELKWETVEQLNFAVDFGFLGNSLSGTLEYFDKKTKDMIIAVPVPVYAGIAPSNQNFGAMQNRGFEATLRYQNKLPFGLEYDISGNISVIDNKVTKLASSDSYIDGASSDNLGYLTRTSEGQEIAYFYGLKTDGIFHSDAEAEAYVDAEGNRIQPNAKGGDVKFLKKEGRSGVIDGDDRVKLGSALPDFTYGLNIGLFYKGFDMKMFFQGVKGNEIVNSMRYFTHSSNVVESNVSVDMINAWTPQNSNSDIPRVVNGDPNQNFRFSDRYVEDGSFLRFKNLQIGYTFPIKLVKKAYANSIRLYASVDNLYTWTKYTGFDPEVSGYGYYNLNTGSNDYSPLQSGIDRANYPVTRKMTVGINVKF